MQISSTLAQQSTSISVNSGAITAVASTAASNSAMINALRTAIISAALTAPSGGSNRGYPSISSVFDGAALTVDSGSCNVVDLCDSASFAATLKATLVSL